MDKEFDEFIGYERYDNKIKKSNYRSGSAKKKVKSEFEEF